MSQTALYKGYTIRSAPSYVTRTCRWTIAISITWEHGGVEIDLPFSLDTPYPTEYEADVHGITYGQQLIDGKVAELSVEQEQLFLPKGK